MLGKSIQGIACGVQGCVTLHACILRKLLPSAPLSQLTAGDQSGCSACLMALPQVSPGYHIFGEEGKGSVDTTYLGRRKKGVWIPHIWEEGKGSVERILKA